MRSGGLILLRPEGTHVDTWKTPHASATRTAVMEDGHIVECRPTIDLLNSPAHSYTRKPIAALPLLAKAVNF